MKKEGYDNLSGLSIEELNKRSKTLKTVTGALAGLLLVQFAVGIYLTIVKQGFNVFLVVPIAFLPILIINYNGIKKINEELAKRKN